MAITNNKLKNFHSNSNPMNANYQIAHRLNAFISPPLGFALNAIFIWLILKKTPKEMLAHSRILLQTCTIDILFLAIITVGEPILILIDDHGFVVFYEGYFANYFEMYLLPKIHPLFHYSIFLFLYYLQIFSIVVQFIYRYFTLNLNMKINWWRYLILLLPSIFIVCTFCAMLLQISNPILYLAPLSVNGSNYPAYIDLNSKEDAGNTYIYTFIISMLLALGIIIFCAVKMIKLVNLHAQFNERTRKLNKQLTLTLILLAFFPFCLMTLELMDSILLSQDYFLLTFMNSLSECWPPILNPIIGMLTNRPYLKAIIGGILRRKMNSKTNIIMSKTIQVGPSP